MAAVDVDSELVKAGASVRGGWGQLRFFARRYPLGAIGGVLMALFVLSALFADLITAYSPLSTNAAISLARPSTAHWLGADFMGRDVYSRIIYGARISLAVGIGATVLGGTFGIAIGLMSGYLGGWVDLATQRVIDMLQALPLLVLALVMAASLGPSLQNTIIAIA
ncbi:MAG: ABC transporter permease, partial [Proteobacteria bacterium]|nr:ABC transporter permease [Pseudomonadota bacterium]